MGIAQMFRHCNTCLIATIYSVLMSCGSSLHHDGSKYIGLVVPPYPDSLQRLDGWLFSLERGYPLGGSLVREKATGNYMIFLGKKQLGVKNEYRYSIVQVIPIQPLNNNQRVMTGIMDQCGIAGQYDEDLVLLGTSPPPEKPYVTEFRRGWKINYETQRLDEISVDGVDYRCENVAHTL